MTVPLPNPWTTSETLLIGILLLFFAAWGWRHGLDASIIAGLIVIFGVWLAPQLAAPLGKIINALLGMFILVTHGEFSMENWSAFMNAQYANAASPIDVQNPDSTSMQVLTILIFTSIAVIGFRYAKKKSGRQRSLYRFPVWIAGGGRGGLYVYPVCARSHL